MATKNNSEKLKKNIFNDMQLSKYNSGNSYICTLKTIK